MFLFLFPLSIVLCFSISERTLLTSLLLIDWRTSEWSFLFVTSVCSVTFKYTGFSFVWYCDLLNSVYTLRKVFMNTFSKNTIELLLFVNYSTSQRSVKCNMLILRLVWGFFLKSIKVRYLTCWNSNKSIKIIR